MRIIWTNWKLAASLAWRITVVVAAVLSMLWLMIGWAAGFDTWHYCLLGPALIWSGVLMSLAIEAWRLQHKFISKPLSFSLPSYRESLRQLSLSVAIPAGLAVALLLLVVFPYGAFEPLYEDMPRGLHTPSAVDWVLLLSVCSHRFACSAPVEACLRMAVGLVAVNAIALLVLVSRVAFPRWGQFIVALASVLFYLVGIPCVVAGFLFPLLVWPVVLLICACICISVWGRLGDTARLAQGHRAIVLGEALRRDRIGSKAKVGLSIERPFRRAMERCDHGPSRRHLWGSFFCSFGPILSGWKWCVIGLVFITLIVGYNHWIAGALVFLVFAAAITRIDLPAVSNLLLPAGRRERCRATAVVTLGASLLLAFTAVCLVLLSRYAAPFMPHGRQHEYVTLDFGAAFLPSLLVPWLIGFRLLGYTTPGVIRTSLRTGVGLLVVTLVTLNTPLGLWIGILRPVLFSGVCLFGWVLFLLTLRHVRMRGCLVRHNMGAGE